ncbi:MAG: formyltransferase family protein [Acidobacteriota bacterium]|nr:formyltransferase family protein [Acidobacteriota bacterium]
MLRYLESLGDEVVPHEGPIRGGSGILDSIDFIVSYGYLHILKTDVLERFPKKIINLHISLLPWNRGKDPNLWSFLENTPKGVSIHYIDHGIDTGDLLAQREVAFDERETLRTSYDKLSAAIEDLFREVWPEIRAGSRASEPQGGAGSHHRAKDKKTVEHLLTEGWDTPVSKLIGRARSTT